jgi:hypothetical protein
MLGTVIIIALILILLGGAFGPWGGETRFYGGGYPVGGIVGLILVVVVILVLLGRF